MAEERIELVFDEELMGFDSDAGSDEIYLDPLLVKREKTAIALFLSSCAFAALQLRIGMGLVSPSVKVSPLLILGFATVLALFLFAWSERLAVMKEAASRVGRSGPFAHPKADWRNLLPLLAVFAIPIVLLALFVYEVVSGNNI